MKVPRIFFLPLRGGPHYAPLDDSVTVSVTSPTPRGIGTAVHIKQPAWERFISNLRIYVVIVLNVLVAAILLSFAAFALICLAQLVGDQVYRLFGWSGGRPVESAINPQRGGGIDLDAEFVRFESKYGKKWGSTAEREKKKAIFRRNYLEAQWLDEVHGGAGGGGAERAVSRNSSARFGVNSLADMSDVEFGKLLMPKDHFTKRRSNSKFIRQMNPIYENSLGLDSTSRDTASNYPPHFDWRDQNVVTPVKWQGNCGSCWAFATVATVESAYAVAHGQLRNLSEQELLDCNMDNDACNGGDVDKAFHFVHKHGLVTEDAYPYVARRQNTCSLASEDQRTKIDVAYYIHPDEQSMLDWLVNFGPVNIGINVPPDMKPYVGGVYRPNDYDCKFRLLGTHALLIVGYGTSDEGEKYWIVKNSWGQNWGIQHGYVYFARGVNACGIEDEPVGLLA